MTKRGRILGAGIAAAALAGVALWIGLSRRQAEMVILISIDSLRADHLGTYGYPRDTSPAIDALAASGVVFEDAVSTSSWTLPAHMSLLTSLPPEAHGVWGDKRALGESVPLLSEVLQRAGWGTYGLVSGPYLESRFGYDRGWHVYDDQTVRFADNDDSHSGVTSPRLHERAVQLLDEALDRGCPCFLFLHYWDVHFDYQPPPPYDTLFDPDYQGPVDGREYAYDPAIRPDMDPRDLEHIVALYDGEIRWVDHHLGLLFEALRQRGRFDESLIAVTSDHGDEFFEHGRKGHRNNLFDPALRIPLVIKYPERRHAGTRVAGTVGLGDIAPTLLAAAGLDAPETFLGVDLNPLLAATTPRNDRPRFAHLGNDTRGRFAVVDGAFKWIRRSRPGADRVVSLYDRTATPPEVEDQKRRRPARQRRYAGLHRRWQALSRRLAEAMRADRIEYSPELERELEALGYL